MKRILYAVSLMTLTSFYSSIFSQTINWNGLDNRKHILNLNFGLDHSVSYGIGYGFKLKTKLPIILNTYFSIPVGEDRIDDLKTKVGAQIALLNTSNFVGAISIFGIYRKHENPYVRLQNFGSDMKGNLGYYKKSRFIAFEVGFDKAIVTHFNHTQEYKNEVYANVQNGWYEPATGGNFYYGIQTGFAIKKVDITLNLGRVLTQDFKTSPFLPFYLNFGLNYKM
jgi:hypothetical protein